MHVLFAQQSSIPHYRIPFYNSLELLRPNTWNFEVVFDPSEIKKKLYFKDDINPSEFRFPTLNVNTHSLKLGGRILTYQNFFLNGGGYDLIILEDAINNLTYPLCNLHKITGTRIAYWGLGRDRKVEKYNPLTYLVKEFKLYLNRNSDGYFAYTEGVKEYLSDQGIPKEKVFPVNNTIDITKHRSTFERLFKEKEVFKDQFGLSGKKVLVFVSTFKESKRVGFLLKAFSELHDIDEDFHLLLVGGGGSKYFLDKSSNGISYFGSVTEIDRLAPIYIASDIFVYPGQVGLAPIQALCYNLPVITIDSNYLHGPEIEYLDPGNSIILNQSTNPEKFAQEIINLFEDEERLARLKANTWPSIKHLTIENMTQNFIFGINSILGL